MSGKGLFGEYAKEEYEKFKEKHSIEIDYIDYLEFMFYYRAFEAGEIKDEPIEIDGVIPPWA